MACIYTYKGKQYSEQEIKDIVFKEKVKPEDIKFATLDDIANILAYSNSKIIADGWKVEYSTPLGNKYDTLEEVNNEIRGLADANAEVDLSGVKINIQNKKDKFNNNKEIDKVYSDYIQEPGFNFHEVTIEYKDGTIKKYDYDSLPKEQYNFYRDIEFNKGNINNFIEKNKEYAQSKEIIEQWKKENNIQYDPEEIYSRGQGFYSSIGAYSNLELDLLLKNLIQHIQDNKKAGGEFTISAFTKPIDKRLKHIEGTGDRVRFVIYPKSEHIKWAAPTDVYSGSVWDAHEKVSKDKKSELLGVSFTKAPALININEVSPNLADIIDNLSHAHNELGIELTTDNFRVEYDDNIDYSTKKLIDNINKILDQKYGKLEKVEIKNKKLTFEESKELKNLQELSEQSMHLPEYLDKEDLFTKKDQERLNELSSLKGKQPTQTRENTTSIESVKNNVLGIIKTQRNLEREDLLNQGYKELDYGELHKPKEYTSQAETNLKIAALKEVARKYPRSLITSKVVPINPNLVDNSEIQYSKIGSKQDIEGFKEFVNKSNKFVQESGSLQTLTPTKIENLQNTVEYQLLNEKDEDLDKKVGQSYMFLSEKDAERFTYLVEKNKEFPEEFKVTKKITKYERDSENPLKFNGYNVYKDFYYIKSNKNKKSNLYDIINKETGEIIASKVRVLSISRDSKSEIAKKYGLEHTPTKIFSANRSIAFALYRQKPSKAKYIAQAKKYLYDAVKFLNPEETNLKINLDKIEELLNSFPEEMWDYINTTYSPEDSTNINASTSLQNEIKFNLPKLGFIQELEKITGLKLLGTSFKNYDRSGKLAKVFKYSKIDGEWGNTITIDNSMTTKELNASIKYYLSTKNIFKQTSEEENVRKYAEHRGIDYDKLKELVFGDIDKALDNISYNNTGNSDTIELSKWRESIRNYDWQSVELFSKPYKNFQNTVKERIIAKFKDKNLSNGISHLEYFFNSGSFNWLNINFNNISGQYYLSDMETGANVGVGTQMGGIINPFEMKIYQKPKAGENFLQEKEVFNRLAAVLHEPFHALHALSYGTKEELELRKAFDNLYNTSFGKEMMHQVFGSGYNKGQQISYDTLYKEFTAFTTQLMLYPKQWIKNTDLRSNDIYEFIEKIQTLQDKTYEEIVKTQQKIGTIEKTITEEEKIKLSFLEKLYNYLVKALNKIIPLSKKFTNLIVDSKLVEKKVIEDVFGEVEETVTKTLKLPDNVKKSKEQFLEAMEELQSAINTLMQIDGKLFSSENITNFFTSNKFNQEQGSVSDFITQKSQERLNQIEEIFNQNPELNRIGTIQQYASYLDTIFPDSKVTEIDNSLYNSVLNQLEQENIIEKDCSGGKLKAKDGLRTKFTKGSQWEIYEIFEGKSHKQGGIDINIKNNQISFTNKNGSIKAKYGLVIPKDN